MLVSKPVIGETKLSVTESYIPAYASVRKVGASVDHVEKNAAKTLPNVSIYNITDVIGVENGRKKVLVAKLQDKKYRDAYVRATITHGLAHQIRVNREQRNLSQQSLAQKCGGRTTQVGISRLEDPAYGKFTLNSVLKVASALDVAVLVRLVPFSKFLLEMADKSVPGLYTKSFSEDVLHGAQALVAFTITENKAQTQPYVSIGIPPKPLSSSVILKQPQQSEAKYIGGYISRRNR